MIRMKDLRKIVREKTDLGKERSENVVGVIISAIAEELRSEGGTVYLKGVGKLEMKMSKPRRGRNPRTLEPVEIPAKLRVHFYSSKAGA